MLLMKGQDLSNQSVTEGVSLGRSHIHQPMIFMPPMQIASTLRPHILLPTSNVKEGPENMRNNDLSSVVNYGKNRQRVWRAALG